MMMRAREALKCKWTQLKTLKCLYVSRYESEASLGQLTCVKFFFPVLFGGFFFIFLHYFACSHFFHNLPNLSKKKNNAINDHMR